MSFTVSVNPSYLCNFRCSFCYLTKEQLSDRKRVSVDKIKKRLEEISRFVEITHIDLYGGEVGILPLEYLMELDAVLKSFVDRINVVSNLRFVSPYFLLESNDLTVSYDFHVRQNHEIVLENLRSIEKQFSLLTLATPEVIKLTDAELLQTLNSLPNMKSWEVKKYSTNQANSFTVSFLEYEDFLHRCLLFAKELNCVFVNEDQIGSVLNGSNASWSDSHVYLNPNGNFSVLSFDSQGREFFKELQSFEEYLEWSEKEKQEGANNQFCKKCKYSGVCYTEHLRFPAVDPDIYSCDGHKKLLYSCAS